MLRKIFENTDTLDPSSRNFHAHRSSKSATTKTSLMRRTDMPKNSQVWSSHEHQTIPYSLHLMATDLSERGTFSRLLWAVSTIVSTVISKECSKMISLSTLSTMSLSNLRSARPLKLSEKTETATRSGFTALIILTSKAWTFSQDSTNRLFHSLSSLKTSWWRVEQNLPAYNHCCT